MTTASTEFDISGPLDGGSWNRFRQSVVLMMALAILFDGIDNQLLGLAVPAIAGEFNVAKPAFATVFAAGTIGMALGGFCAGLIGDRFGRRRAALGSIILFGAGTAAMGAIRGLPDLMLLRFAAGLGLGGLIPNAVTLIAEFSPTRVRSGAVMAAMSCVPAGGLLAATLVAGHMQSAGWRALFVVGGCGALMLGAVLCFVLPESPRYLVHQRQQRHRLRALLRRMAIEPQDDADFVDSRVTPTKVRMGVLLGKPFRHDTLALCGAALFAHVSSYSFISWLPTTLSQLGLSYADQGLATAMFNVGGIIGILVGALFVARSGSRLPLLLFNAAGIVGALLMMNAKAILDFDFWLLSGFLGLLAGALGVVQTGLMSLAVHIFPSQVRTAGTGLVGAVSRVGALASSFIAAIALQHGGARFFFLSVATVMAICGICLFLVRRHVPPSRAGDL